MTLTSILPWAVAWLLYKGDGIVSVLSWGGLILNGVVGFILPIIVALDSVTAWKTRGEGDVESRVVVEVLTEDEDLDTDRDVIVNAFGFFNCRTKREERRVLTLMLVVMVTSVGFALVGKL
jgi:hypothetical protein